MGSRTINKTKIGKSQNQNQIQIIIKGKKKKEKERDQLPLDSRMERTLREREGGLEGLRETFLDRKREGNERVLRLREEEKEKRRVVVKRQEEDEEEATDVVEAAINGDEQIR